MCVKERASFCRTTVARRSRLRNFGRPFWGATRLLCGDYMQQTLKLHTCATTSRMIYRNNVKLRQYEACCGAGCKVCWSRRARHRVDIGNIIVRILTGHIHWALFASFSQRYVSDIHIISELVLKPQNRLRLSSWVESYMSSVWSLITHFLRLEPD